MENGKKIYPNDVCDYLTKVLGDESQYFGDFSGLGLKGHYYLSCRFSKDPLPFLQKLSQEELLCIRNTLAYFEFQAIPLKLMLEASRNKGILYKLYADLAWTNFMLLTMFGILELTMKSCEDKNLKNKGMKIRDFFVKYLDEEDQGTIVKDFKTFDEKTFENFDDIIKHLWHNMRCEFVHNAKVVTLGKDWEELKGLGTRDNPISCSKNVPIQDFLAYAWQAILRSYGYDGKIDVRTSEVEPLV